MGREFTHGQTEENMKANTTTIKDKALESTLGPAVKATEANGKTIYTTVKEFTKMKKEKLLKVLGIKGSESTLNPLKKVNLDAYLIMSRYNKTIIQILVSFFSNLNGVY